MKKFYSVFLVLILICGVFLGGCNLKLSGGPASTDIVTSNGGISVRKGDYLYFVNGYKSSGDLVGNDNDYGKVTQSAIYRAKLNSDGTLKYDEKDNLTEVEVLMPKVCGFQETGLYIFDDKIYFLTPTTLKDNTGKIRFDLVDFCCANLDGTGFKKIYGAQNWQKGVSKYNFVKVENFVYLTILDGSKLFSIKLNNGKVIYNEQIAEDVTSVAFDTFTSYNPAHEEKISAKNAIYFTRNLNENDSATVGNYMGKLNLGDKKATKVVMDNTFTYTVKQVNDGILYFTKQSVNQSNACWYLKDMNTLSFANAQETQLTATSYTSVLPLEFESGSNRGVIVNTGSKLRWLKNIENLNDDIELTNTVLTSMQLIGNDIYGFNSSGVLCKLNIENKTLTEITTSEETILSENTVRTLIDHDTGFVYYFKQYTGDNKSAYYLSRMALSGENLESEFLGKMLPEHIKIIEEE